MAKDSNTSSYTGVAEVSKGEQPRSRYDAATPNAKTDRRRISGDTIKSLWEEMRIAVSATLVLAVLLCGIYPLAVWGVAQLVFPQQANGSLIIQDGRIVGSELIGQSFKAGHYFHPRPSAAGSDGYDAAASSGSNLGPLSQKLIDQVKERANAYRGENDLPPGIEVPADAVTASASGLDPHISVRNAELQAARVAKERGIPVEEVRKYIAEYTEGPQLAFLGEQAVNILKLNLALDALSK
jgi:K+-transporting ATPase ATPase C chain